MIRTIILINEMGYWKRKVLSYYTPLAFPLQPDNKAMQENHWCIAILHAYKKWFRYEHRSFSPADSEVLSTHRSMNASTCRYCYLEM